MDILDKFIDCVLDFKERRGIKATVFVFGSPLGIFSFLIFMFSGSGSDYNMSESTVDMGPQIETIEPKAEPSREIEPQKD